MPMRRRCCSGCRWRCSYPDGQGLQLRGGAPLPDFVRAVLRRPGWGWGERLSLLAAATRWAATRFRCADSLSVAELCRRLPARVREQLIEPLCVAALNTPATQASAAGLPARAARRAVQRRRARRTCCCRARRWVRCCRSRPQPGCSAMACRCTPRARATAAAARRRWQLDGHDFDAVLLACSAAEAARLCAELAPGWAATAAALRYEPIVTVYLQCPGARLALPMLALHADADAPAQFVFDLGALDGPAGVFAFVISGARDWVDRGLDATAQATLAQALAAFPAGHLADAADRAARGRGKARHLSLHAGTAAPADGHCPRAVGRRRLRRRPLPGHAGRRGALGPRRGVGAGLISAARRARPAARRRTATAAATARSSSKPRSPCCLAGSAAAAIADAETSAGGCRAR